MFEELVAMSIAPHSPMFVEAVLSIPGMDILMKSLRNHAGLGEEKLEFYWSTKVVRFAKEYGSLEEGKSFISRLCCGMLSFGGKTNPLSRKRGMFSPQYK